MDQVPPLCQAMTRKEKDNLRNVEGNHSVSINQIHEAWIVCKDEITNSTRNLNLSTHYKIFSSGNQID